MCKAASAASPQITSTRRTSRRSPQEFRGTIQINEAGSYHILFRATGEPGAITVFAGGMTLASVRIAQNQGDWQTVSSAITLPAGPQTLRIRCEAKGQRLNWIGFHKG